MLHRTAKESKEGHMESRAKLLGHPIHTALIVFPLGLLGMAVIFDLLALAMGQGYWAEIALWMMVAGVVTGLIAAPFGLVDWLAIPARTRAKRIGALHGIGNVIVLLLFAASAWMRWDVPQSPAVFAVTLSLLGLILALVTGWLGGELVDRLGVGVDDGAHVDAPSSLRARRAA
jgi:uncharacterized membrane protein